eukprot:snap_masked-scaffold_29-processed-gene-3.21-mRNA-1 protein AED:1.00 eAED:1.00 QI:0/-1/0/0/-1/1/1/0/876
MKNYLVTAAGLAAYANAKDFTRINQVLADLTLEFDLDVEPQINDVDDIVGEPGTVEVFIGETGSCSNLAITDGGDVGVAGAFTQPNTEYELGLALSGIQAECTIPMLVEVRTRGGSDISDWNINDGTFGTLTFDTSSLALSQNIIGTSTDFRNNGPEVITNGTCTADAGELGFEGEELGLITFLFFPVDLTGSVVDQLTGDPTPITSQIEPLLCNLTQGLATTIADLLTELGELVDVADPLEPRENGTIPALDAQAAFDAAGATVYDFTDTEELINTILFPETDDGERPFFYDLLDIFFEAPEGLTEYDSLLNVIANLLGTELNAEGHIEAFSVLSLIEEGVIDIDVDVAFLDTVILNITAQINQLNVDITDRDGVPVLSNLVALAAQTIALPRATIGSLGIVGGADLAITLENDPTLLPEGSETILTEPFSFDVTDFVGLALDWTGDEGINAKAAALLGIDVDAVGAAQLGPLVESLLGCLLSVLVQDPLVSGLGLGSTDQTINLDLAGIDEEDTEAVLVIVDEIVNAIVPVATAWIPKGLQALAEGFVVNNGELLSDLIPAEDRECPAADEAEDAYPEFAFNFSTGIAADISGALTPEVLNDVLTVIETDENGDLQIDLTGLAEPVSFVVTVAYPEDTSYTQELTVTLNTAAVGVGALGVDTLTVLSTAASASDDIQDVRNEVGVTSLGASAALTISAAQPVNADGGVVAGSYPEVNELELGFSLSTLDALADLLLTYSEYDIKSTELGDILNLDCWTGKLNANAAGTGGVTALSVALGGLEISGGCSSCATSYIGTVVETITDSAAWAGLEASVNGELAALTAETVDGFTAANFAATVAEAAELCSSGTSAELLDIVTDVVQFLVELVIDASL